MTTEWAGNSGGSSGPTGFGGTFNQRRRSSVCAEFKVHLQHVDGARGQRLGVNAASLPFWFDYVSLLKHA